MSRDYKTRTVPSKRSRGGGLLLGLVLGFLLGLGTAAGIAMYFLKVPGPFNKPKPAEKSGVAAPGHSGVPGFPETAKAGKADEAKPRFDFYRILPGQEEPVTDQQVKQAAKSGAASKELYFLQAGSFQNPADADNLKAKLALAGLDAAVAPTDVPDKGVWYRVRLGPFSSVEDINRVRAQLAGNKVEASLVRVKDAPARESAPR
jgi:cell division protein FtsN